MVGTIYSRTFSCKLRYICSERIYEEEGNVYRETMIGELHFNN